MPSFSCRKKILINFADCLISYEYSIERGQKMQPHNEDLPLIRRIRIWNDRSAAEKLVERHYREIYAYTYRQTLEKQLAMDLTQEIFISVLQSIGNYEEKKASFRTWMYRIASCRIADYFRSSAYRSRKMAAELSDESLPPQDGSLSARLEERDSANQVLKEIGNFDSTTQEILRLKLFSEARFPQIAQAVEMPESTVKSRYYAAVKKIQSRLEGKV